MSGSASPPSTVAIIGLGLIGGSLALGLGRRGDVNVRGYDVEPNSDLQGCDAVQLCASVQEAVQNADCVVIATPVLAMEGVLRQLHSALNDRQQVPVMTDTSSAKGAVVGFVRDLWGEIPPQWIFSHPLAGSENSGFGAADGQLYQGAPVLLSTHSNADESAYALVCRMWDAVGGVPRALALEEHDAVLALTSHLPHLLAFALMRTLLTGGDEKLLEYSAGGFRDFSRIASSDCDIWADIAISNAEEIINALNRYGSELEWLMEKLKNGDRQALRQAFDAAADSRNAHYEGDQK